MKSVDHARNVVSGTRGHSAVLVRALGALAFGATVLASGCTYVQLDPKATDVKLAQPDQVALCQKVGTASASVLERVLFVDRSATKVSKELETLARNEASKLGGNRVVATTRITNGQQSYDVYSCK